MSKPPNCSVRADVPSGEPVTTALITGLSDRLRSEAASLGIAEVETWVAMWPIGQGQTRVELTLIGAPA